MVRVHRRSLTETWRLVQAEQKLHREALRRSRVHGRPVEEGRPRAEHRVMLEEARRLARSGLGAHRRALAENPWILQLVNLYEKLQALRRAREARKPAGGLEPVVGYGE